MLTKIAPTDVAFEGDGLLDGEFLALVAVFGNVDSDGDRIVKGAFDGTLERWAAKGDPMPVVWSHQWLDPFAHIGEVKGAMEIDQGLLVHAALDLDNPTAGQVRRLLTSRRVRNFSFAYDVLDSRTTSDGVNELLELDVHEVGPALVGANRETDVLAAKDSALRPAGSTWEWRRIREAVLERDGRTCQHCGAPATDVDHLVARADGGTDALDNLVASCQPCNLARAAERRVEAAAAGPSEGAIRAFRLRAADALSRVG